MRIKHIYKLLILIILVSSCSTTKFVPEGEYLLNKVEIKSDAPKIENSTLKGYLRQQPNFKTFGLVKTSLFLYNLSGKDSTKWINKQLRGMGDPPVIYDSSLVYKSESELRRFFINKGYLNANVVAKVDTNYKDRKVNILYDINAHEPYRINEYAVEIEDKTIDSLINVPAEKHSKLYNFIFPSAEREETKIHAGELFDRDKLDQERQRIASILRRKGYYTFGRDNVIYLADSTNSNNTVDLAMRLRPFAEADSAGTDVVEKYKQYYINDVVILTDYDPLKLDDGTAEFVPTDTLKYKDVFILYGESGKSVRPGVLYRSCYIRPGSLYNERAVEQTYASFATLRAFRNISIRFVEVNRNDSLLLDCVVLTTPAKSQTVGFDLEGTNSAGDFGVASAVTYAHRNLFKGSEVLSFRVRGAYEALSKSEGKNYFEIGGEASLNFPTFLFPFVPNRFKRRIRANTEFAASYNFQTRPQFDRTILSAKWGYSWQGRLSSYGRHTVDLMEINYVYLPRIDSTFYHNLPQTTAYYNYSDQFIAGTRYTYSYSNFNPQNKMRNVTAFRFAFESAGNGLYLLSKLTGAEKNSKGDYKLFGIYYSQFVKGDFDFSKTIVLDSRNRIAYRVGFGIGYPYGNADMLPFERRYFAGGANSVRGWSVRTLGPGSFQTDSTTTFFDQSGDIRLDLNLEYRTRLFWKLEMAAFVDAGNIWTIKKYDSQKEGNFDFKRFYKEIALAYGLGFRLDFDFFLLRLDMGMKAYDPQRRGADRWALLKPNFKKDFAWHFAVGYPF